MPAIIPPLRSNHNVKWVAVQSHHRCTWDAPTGSASHPTDCQAARTTELSQVQKVSYTLCLAGVHPAAGVSRVGSQA